MYHKQHKSVNLRERWVIEKPDHFTIVQHRPVREYTECNSYKEVVKLFLKYKKSNTRFKPLVYAVRDTGMANLNHRSIFKFK